MNDALRSAASVEGPEAEVVSIAIQLRRFAAAIGPGNQERVWSLIVAEIARDTHLRQAKGA